MTDAEWRASEHPVPMLTAIQREADPRRLRLLGCRCCRLIWNLLSDPRSRAAVELVERFADGGPADDLRAANDAAEDAVQEAAEALPPDGMTPTYLAATAARAAAHPWHWAAPVWVVELATEALEREGRGRAEWLRRSLCGLIRDMFPPPTERPSVSGIGDIPF